MVLQPEVALPRTALERAEMRRNAAGVSLVNACDRVGDVFVKMIMPQVNEAAPTLLDVDRARQGDGTCDPGECASCAADCPDGCSCPHKECKVGNPIDPGCDDCVAGRCCGGVGCGAEGRGTAVVPACVAVVPGLR